MKVKNIILLVLIFIVGCSSKDSDSSETDTSYLAEYEAALKLHDLPLIERFSFEDLEGNKFDWREAKGKLVFVNFWATWCKPCIKEMPSISKANTQLKKEVLFIIASDEEVAKIKKFESKHHYSFALMHSNTSVFDLDIQALPTTLIINEKGEIVFNEIGVRDWASEKSITLIKSFSINK